jgi:serine O-acetyltransferase
MHHLRADIARYRHDFPSRHLTIAGLMARRVSLQVIAVYRLGRWASAPDGLANLWRRPVLWLVYAPLRGIVSRAYGIRLDLSADIGPGLYIGHVGGVKITHCTIGGQCSLAQQTQIGPAAAGQPGPIVGSRVWIGAHARVLGPIRVGTGATIAAGAHVSTDVPERALVAGNPARVAKWGYDNTAILGHPPEEQPGHSETGHRDEARSFHTVVFLSAVALDWAAPAIASV